MVHPLRFYSIFSLVILCISIFAISLLIFIVLSLILRMRFPSFEPQPLEVVRGQVKEPIPPVDKNINRKWGVDDKGGRPRDDVFDIIRVKEDLNLREDPGKVDYVKN